MNEPDSTSRSAFAFGQDVERVLERHAEREQPVLRRPRVGHRLLVDRQRRGVLADQPRRHVVGRHRVGERHHRPRRRHHAMALILRVGGVAQPLLEHVAGVIERAHHRRVIRDVEHVDAVLVLRRIHHPIDRLGVVHFRRGEAERRRAPRRRRRVPRRPTSRAAATRGRRGADRIRPRTRRRRRARPGRPAPAASRARTCRSRSSRRTSGRLP